LRCGDGQEVGSQVPDFVDLEGKWIECEKAHVYVYPFARPDDRLLWNEERTVLAGEESVHRRVCTREENAGESDT